LPLSLQDLINDDRTVTLDWQGHKIALTYRPSALNRDFYRRTRNQPEDRQWNSEYAVNWLLGSPTDGQPPNPVLIGWDVVGADGKPAPVDEATIAPMNTLLLLAMVDKINADLLPNSPKNETSDDG
jgi:hypothetical protein